MADSTKQSEQKTRAYDPYQDLNVPIQKLYDLPTAPRTPLCLRGRQTPPLVGRKSPVLHRLRLLVRRNLGWR
ncbi:hypothetical protein L6164_035140 [Bauhinia variegata]|uniref:Uncharacterized protein n=1 Tax=Bauhinia variegata TaxID=167791 RepID=A0ACB9KXP4_BAUVA|nr:hypothetical protein L6164_035140 [Bauhinia variegata]